MSKRILLIGLLLLFVLTGCSSNNSATENGSPAENDIQEQEWDGPTAGPWSYWDRNYYPGQYFRWSCQVKNVTDDRLIWEGWLEISMSNTSEVLTRFDYQAIVNVINQDGNETFEYDGMFVLDGQHRENFTHATYDSIAEGQLSEGVHEMFALIDINPLSPYPLGGAYPYLFHDEDFAWEVGTIVTGNGDTMKIVAAKEIAGISGLVIEVDSPQFLGEGVEYEYVINPDLRYPLYLKMTDQHYHTEYILQEYQY